MATRGTPPPRTVECYHCRRGFDVPASAMSISCPWCYKRVTLDDLVVRDTCWTSRIQTCGRIVVERRATLVASHIEARTGMTILGVVEGSLLSGGPVVIGPKAHVKGDLEAPSVDIADGASIEGGFFKITSPRPTPGAKSAGFIRPPTPGLTTPATPATGAPGQSGSVVIPERRDGASRPAGAAGPAGPGELRATVRVPDWIKRRLRTT